MSQMIMKEVEEIDSKINRTKQLIEKTTNSLMKHRMSLKVLEQKRVEAENKAMIDFLRKKGISGEELVENFSEATTKKDDAKHERNENLGGEENDEQ